MTTISDQDRVTVREFLKMAGEEGLFAGRMLDYGCGRQPYRTLVESYGGEYIGYDRVDFPANVSGEDYGEADWTEHYDTVLCTQVVQYIPLVRYGSDPRWTLQSTFNEMYLSLMVNKGHLVMTYPTNWPEDEPEDLHRFTKSGHGEAPG